MVSISRGGGEQQRLSGIFENTLISSSVSKEVDALRTCYWSSCQSFAEDTRVDLFPLATSQERDHQDRTDKLESEDEDIGRVFIKRLSAYWSTHAHERFEPGSMH